MEKSTCHSRGGLGILWLGILRVPVTLEEGMQVLGATAPVDEQTMGSREESWLPQDKSWFTADLTKLSCQEMICDVV